MARIRSIHPGLFTDEGYMNLSLGAKAAWPGVWTECDDHGVFEWKPVTLKAKLLPADNVDMSELMMEFIKHGLVIQFAMDGKQFGVVKGFLNWQRPKSPSYRFPFPKAAELYARNSGSATVGLGEEGGTPTEIEPQRKEEGGRREEEESETSPPATTVNSAAKQVRSAERRGTRLPEDWLPSAEDRAFAADLGLDADEVGLEFRDYWTAIPGAKGRKLDWSKTFRNRCRELGKRPRAHAKPNGATVQTLYTDEKAQWRARLRGYKPGVSMWPAEWGLRPEDGGNRVPADLMAEWRNGRAA